MEGRESLHNLEIRFERDGGDVFHSQCGGVCKILRTRKKIRVDFEKLILYNGTKGQFSHDIMEEKEC